MNFDEKMNRITAITDFYLNRFGRTQIGMFHLPTRDPNSYWFPVFINSLMITLRRKNVMPYNFWIRDPNAGCFRLIIWGNGYFRTDLSDIAPSVEQFWAIHSPDPMAVLGSFSLSTESTVEDFSRFRKAAEDLIQTQPIEGTWHQRTFGGSQVG